MEESGKKPLGYEKDGRGTKEMGQIILGTGKYAEKPYFVEKFYINLYSVEVKIITW